MAGASGGTFGWEWRRCLDLDQGGVFFVGASGGVTRSSGAFGGILWGVAIEVRDIMVRCRLFDRVEGDRLEALIGLAQRRRYRAGTVIFRQGEECPGLYVVGEGLVRVYKLAHTGKEHILHLASPGMTFAEVAVIGGFECPACAAAVEETTCAVLPSVDFRRALERDHGLCLQLLTGMAGWVRQFVSLMEDLVLRDAAGRIARHLLEAARGQEGDALELPGLKRHLASHLNLTSETLSRTLKRLSEAGLVDSVDARRMRVLDAEGLRDVADGLYPEL